MKVGVILTGFNMEDYVSMCLLPWMQARLAKRDGHEFVICAVSLPFVGFPQTESDNTTEALKLARDMGEIDHVITEPKDIPETQARGMALTWLMERGVDLLWQVDMDEFYTTEQIDNILKIVEMNEWVAWWRVSLKNYVFDSKTYLAEPFQPPRIHRVVPPRYTIQRPSCFIADNDVGYRNKDEPNETVWPQSAFASATIPHTAIWVAHKTWQNDLRSKAKVTYQIARWSQCSFSWDDSKGGLIFNPSLPTPKTLRDD